LTTDIPRLCECGCGQPTKKADRRCKKYGYEMGDLRLSKKTRGIQKITPCETRGGHRMNLGASMLAKRVHQDENEEPSFVRGFLIGIPCAIALWMAIIWLWSAVVG